MRRTIGVNVRAACVFLFIISCALAAAADKPGNLSLTFSGREVTVAGIERGQLDAVNAVRGAAGTAAATWTSLGVTAPAAGGTIEAQQLAVLRSAINTARNNLSFPAITFTDATLPGVPIQVLHLTELRGGAQ